MARSLEARLPGRYIRFPNRCARCNAVAEKRLFITVMTFFSPEHEVPVPVCQRCYRIRRRWRAILYLDAALVIFLLLFIILGHLGLLLALVPMFLVIAFFHDHLNRFLDRKIIGVWGAGVSASGDVLTLRFSDHSLGKEVEKLTWRAMRETVGETKEKDKR